jgi:hypothetical protein
MSLIPLEVAPTADAEAALGALRDDVFVRLQGAREDRRWQLTLHGLADEVEDVIVTVRRLAAHERVWRDSMGTRPIEPPIAENPNHNAMQQMVRARADLRSFLLLVDVLLDNGAKALRPLGASKKATESFHALARHLEAGGSAWSTPLLPLTPEIIAHQYSIGYFRDKFVVHRGLLPVGGVFLPDGKVRLMLIAGTKSLEDLARGGREAATILPVPADPLDAVHDVRLDIAFAALRTADDERRGRLAHLLEEFGATSPDPYEAAVEVAETLGKLVATAEREIGTNLDASR